MRDELTSLILLSAIRISESYYVFVSSWIIIQSLTNVREKTKHISRHIAYARWSRYYVYITRAARESRVASLPPVVRSPDIGMRDINSCASECIHTDVLSFLRRRVQAAARRRSSTSSTKTIGGSGEGTVA